MYYPDPDQKINVRYYHVVEGSELHKKVETYWQKAQEFCEKTTAIVQQFNAASARSSFLWSEHKHSIGGLNFSYETAPLKGWIRERSGLYSPNSVVAWESVSQATLPFFSKDVQLIEGTRFDKIGDTFLLACTPNKDGTAPKIAGTVEISQQEVETHLSYATEDERSSFRLDLEFWIPSPLLRAHIFKTPEAVQKENESWIHRDDSLASKWKYSPVGIKVNRWRHNHQQAKTKTTQPS